MCRSKTKATSSNNYHDWMVGTGITITFIIIFPLTQAFSLLYKDIWIDLEFTGTQTTFIICTAVCVSTSTTSFIATLIKRFGCRKIGFLGGCLIPTGFILSAYSTIFQHFVVSFGLIQAFGTAMVLQTIPVVLNSSFGKSRSKVIGYIWVISGLGPIMMPQLITFLTSQFDVKFATLIIAAITAPIAGIALLLRPVKLKTTKLTQEENQQEESKEFLEKKRPEELKNNSQSMNQQIINEPADIISSANEEDLNEEANVVTNNHQEELPVEQRSQCEEVSWFSKALKSISDAFDLALMKDLVFLNILLGLAFDFVSEINYVTLLPFIMSDKYFDTEQTATIMSTISIAEICFRLLAAFIADFFRLRERPMFIITIVGLICARSSILFVTGFVPLIVCSAVIGAFKGMRTVYWMLILPNYLPIEKLPNGLGLQYTVNGIQMLIGGYIFGLVKDLTGSYVNCIYVMNLFTLVPVFTWTVECIYRRYKSSIDITTNCYL